MNQPQETSTKIRMQNKLEASNCCQKRSSFSHCCCRRWLPLLSILVCLLICAPSDRALAASLDQMSLVNGAGGQLSSVATLAEAKSNYQQQQQPVDDNELKAAKQGARSKKLASLLAASEAQQKKQLKNKWHKIVDDLIDGELLVKSSGANFAQQQQQPHIDRYQQQSKNTKAPSDFMDVGSSSGNNENEGDQVLMILRKRLPPSPTTDINQLDSGDQFSFGKEQQQQQQQQPSRNTDHSRRILDDKFDILKESIFTTNNHLGHKGVPKFGSDEVF